MSQSPADATARLAGALSARPPDSLMDLEPVVVDRLSEALEAQSRRQERAIVRAVDDALGLVPRPLRRIVAAVVRP